MSKERIGPGVFKLSNGNFIAQSGIKVIGEFKTEKEAATNYNEYIKKHYSFPIYNKKGLVPEKPEEPIKEIKIEEKIEFNKPLNDYLKNKKQEKIKDDLDLAKDILTNE